MCQRPAAGRYASTCFGVGEDGLVVAPQLLLSIATIETMLLSHQNLFTTEIDVANEVT